MPTVQGSGNADGGVSLTGSFFVLFAALAAIGTYFAITPPDLSDGILQIRLKQGTYTGTTLSNADHPVPIHAWLGIPYAKPPVGKLRFKRPVPLEAARAQSVDVKEYGHRCPGTPILEQPLDIPHEGEDCLTVNVFKQGHSNAASRQPVMVYIHGGAFDRGSFPMHDTASMLAWSPDPFVAVSFNYRLGALGFLPGTVAAKEGILNLGWRDQVLLLEWVQENIAKFGGDAEDVTVVGLGAGAHAAGHHVLNVNRKGELFDRAVMESGGPTSRLVHACDSALHEKQFRDLLEETRCSNEPEERQIRCLREAPSEQIVEAQAEVFRRSNASFCRAWQPLIDGDLISRQPIEAWKSGEGHRVPILIGFNHNEGAEFVPKKDLTSNKDFIEFFQTLLPQLTDDDLARLAELYPDPDTDSSSPYLDTRDLDTLDISTQFKRAEAAYGHHAYVCPVQQAARLGAAAQFEPVYLYHWALNRTGLGGASHADQMQYGTMSPSVRDKFDMHDKIAEQFHSYVTSFVLTGDPNKVPGLSPDRPRWKAVDREGGEEKVMMFGRGNDEGAGGKEEGAAAELVRDEWARAECEFWWAVSERPEEDWPLSEAGATGISQSGSASSGVRDEL